MISYGKSKNRWKNDEKHQRSYEKLLDTMSALNVAQERMLEMMQSDAMTRSGPTRDPAVPSSAQTPIATFTREGPTKVERRCRTVVKRQRVKSPSPLRISLSELGQTSEEEAPEAIKKGVPAPEATSLGPEQPISSVKSGTEKIPEPEPVCTSTKRGKTKALLDSCEPTASTATAVPGTEVTQMIVDTMAKTFQKSLQAIVKPEESRNKPGSYKSPAKDGSIDNWVVLMKRYLDSRKTPMSQKDKAWMILENLEGDARNYLMSKAASELDDPERVFNCLTRRFGSGARQTTD